MTEAKFAISQADENGNAVFGTKVDVSLEIQSTGIRLVFEDGRDNPDLFISLDGDGLMLTLHPGENEDPTLYVKRYADGDVHVSSLSDASLMVNRLGESLDHVCDDDCRSNGCSCRRR